MRKHGGRVKRRREERCDKKERDTNGGAEKETDSGEYNVEA
jgi:hypothetical protein